MWQNAGMSSPASRVAWSIASVVVLAGVSLAASCEDPPECRTDPDCGAGRVCSAGQCVECASNASCADGEFCCQGACKPAAALDDFCGCGASPAASSGQDCSTVDPLSLCLVDDEIATAANVAQGTCGCGCTPARGGPICLEPEGDGAPVCSCNVNQDCARASPDAEGRPHRVANSCVDPGTSPFTCICFAETSRATCDVDGVAPDCTSGGCRDLRSDPANCGVPGRVCTDEATGIPDTGTCIQGGCSCNASSDCNATNANTCTFVDDVARCVCAGYTSGGVPAACPMELACDTGGCVLDGAAFATEESLRSALGLP
jgi:Cys-rich repeat protein